MLRLLRSILLTSVFALVACTASIAFAAPVAWERVHVTLHPEQSGSVLLVSGDLPAAAALPAEAELAVPAGSQLQWIGEIVGTDPAADPDVQPATSRVGAMDVYRFTLARSRTAQIEVLSNGAQAFDGSIYRPVVRWTATQAVPEVRMSVRIPQGSQVVSQAPDATLSEGDAGYLYYSRVVKDVKAGDVVEIAFAYTAPAAATAVAPAAAGGASTAASGTSEVDPARVVLVVGALLVVTWIVLTALRIKPRAAASDADDLTGDEGTRASRGAAASARKDRSPARSQTSDADDAPEPVDASARRRRTVLTSAIAGTLLVVTVVVGIVTSKPQASGDTISQTFSQGAPCATVDIALKVPAGAEAAKTAEALFAALRPLSGMNSATYNHRTASVQVGYCESSLTEDAVRAALARTGMVAAQEATGTPPAAP